MNAPEHFDVIVVGARVAGSATAMLLARHGWRVLVLERGRPGTDTVSTHALMKGAVLQLHRWGLLDEVMATGAPAIRHATFHYGDESLRLPVKPVGGIDAMVAPRRTVLDPILGRAAADAGADVRFGVTATALVRDADGRVIGVNGRAADGGVLESRATLVIGADGARSMVARSVGAEMIERSEHMSAFVYAYLGTSADGFDGYDWCYRPGSTAGVIPTNDGVVAWVGTTPQRYEREVRRNVDAAYWSLLESTAPEVAPRLAALGRTSRFVTFSGHPAFLRRGHGPGWALVGDASHFTDPASAHGLTDAMRDAELLARAVDVGLDDASELARSLRRYEAVRDRLARPMLAVSDRIASYRWDMTEVRAHLLALSEAMRDDVRALHELEVDGASETAA